MITPRITVIVPVYNSEKYLNRCIDSLRAQTFTDFEALFIDDCSTDASAAIIEGCAKNDPRIKLIRQSVNGGSGLARNTGIENASGEYLSFIDADDAVSPSFLELLNKKAEQTNAEIIKGSCIVVTEFADMCAFLPSSFSKNFAESYADKLKEGFAMYNLFYAEHWSAIYRHSFIKEHNLRYGASKVAQDSTFLLKIGYYAKTLEVVKDAKYYYFQNSCSAVRSFSLRHLFERKRSLEERLDFINDHGFDPSEAAAYIHLNIFMQLAIHSYMCVQSEYEKEAQRFLKELFDSLNRFEHLDELINRDYSLRVLIESKGTRNVSVNGIVYGLACNSEWRIAAYGRLMEHLNSAGADKAAGVAYLIKSLYRLEKYFKQEESAAGVNVGRQFCEQLQSLLSKLNDKQLFLENGGLAARAMLDHGVNLFLPRTNDLLVGTENRLKIIERILRILETHPDESSEYIEYAINLSDKLLLFTDSIQKRFPEIAVKVYRELYEQKIRLKALEKR